MRLYVLHDKGIFSRYKVETGERVFRSRVAPEGPVFTASPWAYNGKVFLLSEEGNTFVAEAGEEYRLLGVNSLDEFALATPAIVGDRLLIRYSQPPLFHTGTEPTVIPWLMRAACSFIHVIAASWNLSYA